MVARYGDRFLRRAFHEDERGLGAASLAARWAAKEALFKALGIASVGDGNRNLLSLRPQFHEIRVSRGGSPRFDFFGATTATVETLIGGGGGRNREKQNGIIHLSISHDEKFAIAIVVIERPVH